MKHAIIFKTLWKERKDALPSQKEIAQKLNMDESFFSRFLQGKQDIKSYMFLDLVRAMPADFQIEYWRRVARELKLVGLPPFSFDLAKEEEDTTFSEIVAIVKGLGIDIKMLDEMLDDVPKASQVSIPSIMMMNNFLVTIAGYKLTEMIQKCVEEKTEDRLKEKMKFLCLQKIDWEIFQEMVKGDRYPQSKREVEELKMLVDTPDRGMTEKYSLFDWVGIFLIFDRQIQGVHFPFSKSRSNPENKL